MQRLVTTAGFLPIQCRKCADFEMFFLTDKSEIERWNEMFKEWTCEDGEIQKRQYHSVLKWYNNIIQTENLGLLKTLFSTQCHTQSLQNDFRLEKETC